MGKTRSSHGQMGPAGGIDGTALYLSSAASDYVNGHTVLLSMGAGGRRCKWRRLLRM